VFCKKLVFRAGGASSSIKKLERGVRAGKEGEVNPPSVLDGEKKSKDGTTTTFDRSCYKVNANAAKRQDMGNLGDEVRGEAPGIEPPERALSKRGSVLRLLARREADSKTW